jgi:hypothetical protein
MFSLWFAYIHCWATDVFYGSASKIYKCYRTETSYSIRARQETGISRVEAGSNTSTVTLRVVGGDEKGSLESETVKYGYESHGTMIRKLLR